jgi:hypothetical protein
MELSERMGIKNILHTLSPKKRTFWFLIPPLILWALFSIYIYLQPLPNNPVYPENFSQNINGLRGILIFAGFLMIVIANLLDFWTYRHKQKKIQDQK